MFSYSLLEKVFKKWPPYLLRQAKRAIFDAGLEKWADLKYLPKELREILERECPLEIKAKKNKAKDGQSIKAGIILDDGNIVESVLMRYEDKRNTVCVSSQVGCAMGCAFCATGKLGLTRNLTADEIIAQVLFFQRILKKENKRVSGIVFMGMGEPMLNYDEVMRSIKIINDKDCFNIASRHISISTCGIVAGIKRIADELLQLNLAISLHASNDKLRSELMPINDKHNLEQVLETASEYIQKTGRKLMIEYVLLKGINDSEKDALELAKILKKYLRRLFFVNLIAYNQTSVFKSSDVEVMGKFKQILEEQKINVVERYRFGRDIQAACGQLAGKKP